MESKPRIAWLSAPRAGSASAHTEAELIPFLRGSFEIEQFSPGGDRPLADAVRVHREKPFDLFFYQVEDDPECDPVRAHLLLVPGAVLYHDVWFVPREEKPVLASVRASLQASS